MFGQFYFTEEFQNFLRIYPKLNQLQENRNQALLKEGLDAFDAILYNLYDNKIRVRRFSAVDRFFKNKFEEGDG